MAVREGLGLGEVEEPQVLRGHDRLLDDVAVLVEPGVGAPPVIRHGHGTVGVESDTAAPSAAVLRLVGRIGDDLEDEVPGPTRSERGGIPPDARQMSEIHGAYQSCVVLRQDALEVSTGHLHPVA